MFYRYIEFDELPHIYIFSINHDCEMLNWVYENIGHSDYRYLHNGSGIQLRNEEDAVAFKLRWT